MKDPWRHDAPWARTFLPCTDCRTSRLSCKGWISCGSPATMELMGDGERYIVPWSCNCSISIGKFESGLGEGTGRVDAGPSVPVCLESIDHLCCRVWEGVSECLQFFVARMGKQVYLGNCYCGNLMEAGLAEAPFAANRVILWKRICPSIEVTRQVEGSESPISVGVQEKKVREEFVQRSALVRSLLVDEEHCHCIVYPGQNATVGRWHLKSVWVTANSSRELVCRRLSFGDQLPCAVFPWLEIHLQPVLEAYVQMVRWEGELVMGTGLPKLSDSVHHCSKSRCSGDRRLCSNFLNFRALRAD